MESAAQLRHPGVHTELLHDRATCECVRCTGFLPGHKINEGRANLGITTHGAFARPLVLAPEAERLAEQVRQLMPFKHDMFEGTLQSYCILLIRIQRATDALQAVENEEWDEAERGPKPTPFLGEELRRWMASALKHAKELGLTPSSAATIMRDTRGEQTGQFKPPSARELRSVSLPKLRELHRALTQALEPDEIIDAVE